MDKNELIITALQQRIGELVAAYELQIAVIRADYTFLEQSNIQQSEKIDELRKSVEETEKAQEVFDVTNALYEKKIAELNFKIKKLENANTKKTKTPRQIKDA